MKLIQVKIENNLFKRFRLKLMQEGKLISQWLREQIQKYLGNI